jgi:pectin methylesterase-like acyl-CoA thioesterase
MRKLLVVAFVSVMFHATLLSLAGAFSISKTIWVPDDYAKVQDAVNAAENGDTVRVRAGTYDGNVKINRKSISIIGDSASNTILRGLKPTSSG